MAEYSRDAAFDYDPWDARINSQGNGGTPEPILVLSRLVSWSVVYTKQAQKDARKVAASHLQAPTQRLLDVLNDDPFQNPQPFEKLVGDLAGAYSRRINIQHRLVYQIYEEEKTVKVLRMWSHYE